MSRMNDKIFWQGAGWYRPRMEGSHEAARCVWRWCGNEDEAWPLENHGTADWFDKAPEDFEIV